MDSFDPKSLALPNTGVGRSVGRKPPRHRQGEKFLKGPIPWIWMAQAARLTGKALEVGIALWFLAGVQHKRTVKLSGAVLKDLGVSRFAGYRALTALEEAGLVLVQRHIGQNPAVTILELKRPE